MKINGDHSSKIVTSQQTQDMYSMLNQCWEPSATLAQHRSSIESAWCVYFERWSHVRRINPIIICAKDNINQANTLPLRSTKLLKSSPGAHEKSVAPRDSNNYAASTSTKA